MCTISWLYSKSGYTVLFNRDEGKKRVKAIPPEVVSIDGTKAIMPTDPQGKGTWLAVNEYGLTFALLNFYQGRLPKGKLISRGQIVRNISNNRSLDELDLFWGSLNLSKYAPFSLLCFSPDNIKSDVENNTADSFQAMPDISMWRWTGKELQVIEQSCPLISSAYKFEEVNEVRLRQFDGLAQSIEAGEDGILALERFHCSHEPTRSAYSVCMHREEAETMSLSKIHVAQSHVQFQYLDGAPCTSPSVFNESLERVRDE